MKFTTAVATAATLAGSASAHIAMWHPSMYGWNEGTGPIQPLRDLNFNQWWFHGYMDKPPADGVFMELPSGGTFKGEVSCHKAFTTYSGYKVGEDVMGCDKGGADGKGGPLHSTDTFGIPASQTKNVKGCGLAIAYKSDPTTLKPEDFVVISIDDKCPWRREVDFPIPAGLLECPPDGCHCSWGWIHASDAGTQQMYHLVYKCKVTGQTSNRAIPGAQIARKCPVDKSNCTVGAKQPHYWLQNERNNNFQYWTDAPFYNSDYGFMNGAQTDIWDRPKIFARDGTDVTDEFDIQIPEEIAADAQVESRRVPPQGRRSRSARTAP